MIAHKKSKASSEGGGSRAGCGTSQNEARARDTDGMQMPCFL